MGSEEKSGGRARAQATGSRPARHGGAHSSGLPGSPPAPLGAARPGSRAQVSRRPSPQASGPEAAAPGPPFPGRGSRESYAERPPSSAARVPAAPSSRRAVRPQGRPGRPGAWSRRVPGLALRLQPRPSAARDARLRPRRPRALPAPAPLAPARPPSLPPGPGPSPGLALRARPAALLRRADRCGRRRAAGTAGCCRARWAAGSALARCAASGPGRSSGAAPSPASAAWRRRGPAPGPAPGPGAAPSKAAGAAGSEARPRLGARPLGRRPGPGWRVGGCSWPAPPAPNPAPRLSFSLPPLPGSRKVAEGQAEGLGKIIYGSYPEVL